MAMLRDVVEFLDNYLPDEAKDDSWNGLQVEGTSEIRKIIFAVDAGIDTFNAAISEKADMILVHHGHFWKSSDPSISGWQKERIDLLLKNNISLYVSHLPLDRHREIGNNSELLKLLGAEIKEEFMIKEGKNIGWIGEMKKEKSLEEVKNILKKELDSDLRTVEFGKDVIKTIAVCSGSGGYWGFYEALDKKVDLYLTGDPIEVYMTAKDAKMNIIFAGHHATETLGLKALMKVVEDKFNIEARFLDLPTGF